METEFVNVSKNFNPESDEHYLEYLNSNELTEPLKKEIGCDMKLRQELEDSFDEKTLKKLYKIIFN